jgi:hypothetical protein
MPKPLIYVALSQGVLHELEFASYLPQIPASKRSPMPVPLPKC